MSLEQPELIKSSIHVDANLSLETKQVPIITLVLDCSGSMYDIADRTITSVNNFIDQQKQRKADGTLLTIITFSDEVKTIVNKVPIEDVSHISKADYFCDGHTALYSAIDVAISRNEGENSVLVAIVTDGEDNASKISYQTLSGKIEKKKQLGWSFIYLANEPHIAAIGDNLGMNNLSVGFDNIPAAIERTISAAAELFRTNSELQTLSMY